MELIQQIMIVIQNAPLLVICIIIITQIIVRPNRLAST
jgi:hypothetical protein